MKIGWIMRIQKLLTEMKKFAVVPGYELTKSRVFGEVSLNE